ncbi:MAG: four helix bundle protein [Candidatus Moranbacteria bacterium]|nr:four helix bundle protein [Candidatus Moranbacteria bacterium]
MARFEKFEDIEAWQRARKLTCEIYKEFKHNRDFSFKDQIQRATLSIGNNIAEGFERKGNKEFCKFLFISKGSCSEVRSMLYSALDLGYINEDKFRELYKETVEISKMLSGLIKKLRS